MLCKIIADMENIIDAKAASSAGRISQNDVMKKA